MKHTTAATPAPAATTADTPATDAAHPVLTIADAKLLEAALFAGDETCEWPAMCRAGHAIGAAVLRDFRELAPGGFPDDARVLVLVGKGHNGADALLAAKHILEKHPRARADVCFAFGERTLRPLAMRAWRELMQAFPGSADILPATNSERRGALHVRPKMSAFLATEFLATGKVGRTVPVSRREIAAHRDGSPCQENALYALCLDGIFGFQFRPPMDARVAALIERVNALPIRFRAAVDLPSGLGGATVFRADFTYATGIVKTPVLGADGGGDKNCGRVRYLDLGFFGSGGTGVPPVGLENSPESRAGRPCHSTHTGGTPVPLNPLGRDAHATRTFVLTPAILAPLRALRPACTDKRDYGHLFIVGGSRSYPGAILMSVLAALRSGAGLVTAFVPETLAPAFAARAPEAIWHGLAETPDGGLAREKNLAILREYLAAAALPVAHSRAASDGADSAPSALQPFSPSALSTTARPTALLLGPGLAREPETLALAADLARMAPAGLPLVIDADALQPAIVAAGNAPRILTPHAGEHARIAGAIPKNAVVVRKGPLTRIEAHFGVRWQSEAATPLSDAPSARNSPKAVSPVASLPLPPHSKIAAAPTCLSPFGGPVLARGGSGDLLAGIIGAQLAQTPQTPFLAACRGTVWHGLAAEHLARARGQHAVRATELLDFLPQALHP